MKTFLTKKKTLKLQKNDFWTSKIFIRQIHIRVLKAQKKRHFLIKIIRERVKIVILGEKLHFLVHKKHY